MRQSTSLKLIYKLLILQGTLLALVALIFYVSVAEQRLVSAGSVFLGGLVNMLPNLYFARRLFANSGANAAKQIVKNLYFGEFMKFILTIVLVISFMHFFAFAPLAFFVGFIVAALCFWLILLVNV